MHQGFWMLAAPEEERLLARRNDKETKSEIIKCLREPGHQRGGKRLGPLSAYLPRDCKFDFIWTWHSDCLISPKALDVFFRAGLNGFEAKPAVTRFKHSSSNAPSFLELRPTGWGGVAPPESGVELTDFCEACGSTEYSAVSRPELLIDEAQWDGSDFFIVWPAPRFIFISERAREVIMENQLSGAVIVSVANSKPRTGMGFSPGTLEYWFPSEKVRELKAKYDGIE